MSTDPPPSNSFDGDNGSIASMHRYCIAQHRRAINLSYVDTRVAVVELEDLWAQYWHRSYQPRYAMLSCRIDAVPRQVIQTVQRGHALDIGIDTDGQDRRHYTYIQSLTPFPSLSRPYEKVS